jgi:hypothetical protein
MGVNKLYNIYQAGKQILKKRKIAPTITEPKQLKKTLKKISQDYKYSSAREKESFKRLNKKLDLEEKRKEGIKASKELKKMVDTGQAERIGSRNKIFSKEVPPKRTQGEGKKDEFVVDKIEKKAKGGRIGFKKGSGKSGVPAMDIKSTPTKKLSEKQKKIAKLAGNPEKIDRPDFKVLQSRRKNKKLI